MRAEVGAGVGAGNGVDFLQAESESQTPKVQTLRPRGPPIMAKIPTTLDTELYLLVSRSLCLEYFFD